MDYKSIEHLIKTASETGLTYFEMETEGIRIAIKKENSESVGNYVVDESDKNKDASINNRNSIAQFSEKEEKIEELDLKVVTSPIVGTFYISSDPKAEPFVKVGDKVKKGDTLCLIEAMKLMNEIESEVEGEIVEILVKNEQMVEYGQKLFKIK